MCVEVVLSLASIASVSASMVARLTSDRTRSRRARSASCRDWTRHRTQAAIASARPRTPSSGRPAAKAQADAAAAAPPAEYRAAGASRLRHHFEVPVITVRIPWASACDMVSTARC